MSEACRLSDRAVISVSGSQAHEWLQGLITNDMDKVNASRGIYAALLTPQGKILFDFFIVKDGDRFLLDVEARRCDDLIKRLTLYKLRSDVAIERMTDMGIIALHGEQAVKEIGLTDNSPGAAHKGFGGIAFVDPRSSAMGLRIIGSHDKISDELDSAMVKLSDERHYHLWRLTLGISNGSADLVPDKAFVLESNLDELHGVDFKKGCYVGQEVTSRTKHRGTVRKRIMPVEVGGDLPSPGTAIKAGDTEIGTLLSGQDRLALALIRVDRWHEARDAGVSAYADDKAVQIRENFAGPSY